MAPRMFRIMSVRLAHRKETAAFLVPWSVMEPHEDMAMHNHDQTLEKLNSRGGLDPVEAMAVIKGIPWGGPAEKLDIYKCIEELKEMAANAEQSP